MTNLGSVLKSRDTTLPTKVCIVKAMVFPVVMHSCESWTVRRQNTKELMPSNCSVRFSSVTQLRPNLCDPMDCSTPGFLIRYQLLELTQTHVHRVGDAIQPSHPLSSPSPPAFNLSQYQGLFQSGSSSHQVAKVLEFQLQHQSFQ